jgi:hypothetical protein
MLLLLIIQLFFSITVTKCFYLLLKVDLLSNKSFGDINLHIRMLLHQ